MQCNRKRKRAGSTRSSLPTDQRRRNITMPGITALWGEGMQRDNFIIPKLSSLYKKSLCFNSLFEKV